MRAAAAGEGEGEQPGRAQSHEPPLRARRQEARAACAATRQSQGAAVGSPVGRGEERPLPALLQASVEDPAKPLLAGNAAWQCPGHGTTISLGGDGLYLLHHALEELGD